MRFHSFLFFIAFLSGCSSVAQTADHYHDHFRNYADLSSHLKEGEDYRVVLKQASSPELTIFAIHGGVIESGTSELAVELAGNDSNLYLFEGLKASEAEAAHLTSTHFDEPRALKLAAESENCVSLHGFIDSSPMATLCVGGGSTEMKAAILNGNLDGVKTVPCASGLAGKLKRNIVNQCGKPGLQLEMSTELRNRIVKEPLFRKHFAEQLKQLIASSF